MSPVRLLQLAVLVLSTSANPAVLADEAAVPVVVADVIEREMTPMTRIAGTVISRNDTRLAAQVEGQVVWVAEVGTLVAQSEDTARLDDVMIRERLVEDEASVAREQASVIFNASEIKRLQRLAKDNNAALSRVDQSRRDLAVARSELAAAKARAKQTREKLVRTGITAPFEGVVTEQFIQVGEWADIGTPIVRLVDTRSLEVQAWVPVSALPYIRRGMELDLTAEGHTAVARVRTLVPVGDDLSRLYELRLLAGASDWSAGQSVRVSIPTAVSRQTTVVPRDALVLRRDGASVFRVLDDNTVERVPVTTGVAAGDYIEVNSDINPGDRVVIRGGERLRSGQAVTLVSTVPDE